MIKALKIICSTLLLMISLSSCLSPKEIVYLQNDSVDQSLVNNNYKTTFKSDDLIQIIVNSEDVESSLPFNLAVISRTANSKSAVGQPIFQSYLVDNKGFIDFPVLGELKVAGLSRENLIKNLKNKLSPDYVKNPSINIKIVNFKVTILGDVKSPGRYVVENERITIMEALGLAGDLTPTALRNIEVHREENNKKNIYYLDLLSKKTYTSPAYYLQQNDLVYVKPNYAKVQHGVYNPNTGLFVSIASIFIALASIIVK